MYIILYYITSYNRMNINRNNRAAGGQGEMIQHWHPPFLSLTNTHYTLTKYC